MRGNSKQRLCLGKEDKHCKTRGATGSRENGNLGPRYHDPATNVSGTASTQVARPTSNAFLFHPALLEFHRNAWRGQSAKNIRYLLLERCWTHWSDCAVSYNHEHRVRSIRA